MRSYLSSLFGCFVVVACLCASGLALILPRSVPRQQLGKSPQLRWKSGTTCSTAGASNNDEHGGRSKPLSLMSSKVPSSTLLMAGMFGNVMPIKPAAAPKLKATKLLPQKAPSTFFDQIRHKLGVNKKTVEVVRKGVQKVAKKNQKLVQRSVEKVSPAKAKAAASRLIQQAQRRAFLTKVGLAAAVLYLVWTFGIKELLRGWEKKELKVWVDAVDDLDYYEVRKEHIPAMDSAEPSLEQQQQQQKEEYWWSSPLPSNTSTQLFAPDMATSVQRSLGANQTSFLSALQAAWKRILVNAQRPTDLAQALQGSAFRAQLAEALLDAAPVGTFPGEVISVISDALIEFDVPHLPQPGKTLQLQQLLAAVRGEWLQSPNPAESFARVVTALLVVLVDKAVETIVQGREPAATFAALTDVTDLIRHAEILYTRLIPAHIPLPFVQYHGAAKSHQLEQLYEHVLEKTHKASTGLGRDAEQVQELITNLEKLQVTLRITDARRTVIEQQYLFSIVDNYDSNAPKYERELAYRAGQEEDQEKEQPTEDDKLLSEIAPKFQPEHSAVLEEPAEAVEEAGEALWLSVRDTVVEERSMTQAETKTETEGDALQMEESTRVDHLSTDTVADALPCTQAITETSPPDEVPVVSVTIDTTSTSESSERTVSLETIATDDDDDIFGDSSSDGDEDGGIAAAAEISGAAVDAPSEILSASADDVIVVIAVDAPVTALSPSSQPIEEEAVVTKREGEDGIISSADAAVMNVVTVVEVSEGLEGDTTDINIKTTTTAVGSSIEMEANENRSVLAGNEGHSATTVDTVVAPVPTAEDSVVEANEQTVVVEVESPVEGRVSQDPVEQATAMVQEEEVIVDDSVKHINGGGHTDTVTEVDTDAATSIVDAVSDVVSEPLTTTDAETEDTSDTASSAISIPEVPTSTTPMTTPTVDINATTTTTTSDLFDNPFDEVVQGRPASLTQALQDSTFRALVAQALVERIPHGTFPLEAATTLSEALVQPEVDHIESLTGTELLKQIQQAVEKEEITPLQTAEGLAQVATALAVLLVDRALPTLAHISHTSTVDALDVLTDFLTRAGNLYMSLVAEEVTVAPIEYTGGAPLSRLEDLYYRYTKAAVAASVNSQPSKTADSSGSGNNDSGVKMSHQHVLKLQKLQAVLKVSRQRRAKVEQRVIAEHKAAMMENQSSGGASDNKATSNISTSPQPPQQQKAHSSGASTSTSTSVQRNHAHKQGMPPHNKLGGSGSGSPGAGNIKNVPQAKWGAGVGFGAPKKPVSRPVVHDDEAAAGEEVRGQKKMASTGSGPTLTNEQRHQLENMNPEFFEEIQVRLATGRIDLREVLILEKTLGFTVNSAVRSLELAPGTKLRRLHSALGQSHGDVVDIFRKLAALKEGK